MTEGEALSAGTKPYKSFYNDIAEKTLFPPAALTLRHSYSNYNNSPFFSRIASHAAQAAQSQYLAPEALIS